MSQTSKGRAVEVVCPYCQNQDPTQLEEQAPRGPTWTLRKFVCGVCSKAFVVKGEGARA